MIQFENAVKRYNEIILDELKEVGIVCWLAGGALRDYFMGKPVKTDYDIFFPSEKEYEKASTYFKAKEAEIKWESENGMKVNYSGRTFDLVKKFFETPSATINEFDFTASMIAVDNEKVYHGETTFIDIAKRQLMINKITYPASTMSRAFRYYKKGFSMCLGEMKKLVESIQNMPKEEVSEQDDNEISSGEMAAMFIGID
ncbi:hypothetical protein [Flagellimonas nanhaiensis]|uniref:Uncharacterized protein n=1 Tax=Flagellimonas nanhaiensis TaxID=2292706 RepID=A0A371JNW7_9FLAO|nr:hypothetical protein [Allomuricauda nanhaiensis]RDY58914.1 hypothetical protein DX873_14745 [Allomuricauda nanhaiensis]